MKAIVWTKYRTYDVLNSICRLADHCILKLTRTIADLVECEEIQSVHLAEALQ